MSMFDKLRHAAQGFSHRVNGDKLFLAAAAAAVAAVTYADGTAEDAEKDASVKALVENRTVAASGYDHRQIQDAADLALGRATTRAGKMENLRAVQAMASRDKPVREDILLMAADVADVDKKEGHAAHGIGADELRVLGEIGNALGLKLADYGIEQVS